MTSELLYALRLIHVIAGIGWLGEVITLNFVLLPALFKASAKDRIVLLTTAFPYVFRLATVLGGAVVTTGLILMLWYTQLNPLILTQSRWGWFVLIGGLSGIALYAFHLFQESGAEQSLAAELVFALDGDDPEAVLPVLRHLAIFPRAGMVVLAAIVALMVAAAHLH